MSPARGTWHTEMLNQYLYLLFHLTDAYYQQAYAADGYLGSRHVKDLHSPTKPVSMQRPVFSTQRPRDTSPALHRGYYGMADLKDSTQ